MNIKTLNLIFFIILSINSYSQREASNWFFGNRAGIRFNSDNSVTVLSAVPNEIGINTNEGCSSFSDSDGNLLLYTDGRTVWDRNHKIMPNGDYFNNTGLLGDPSSTQSGIIIPNPTNSNIFYVFTVDEPHHENAAIYPRQFEGFYTGTEDRVPLADDGFNNGMNYSVIDMSVTGTNGSIGDVISRNNHLVTYNQNRYGEEIKYKCSEKITAVKTQDGNGYWVITHFTNKFYAFKIDENGVNATPVVTQINPMVPTSGYRRNSIGYLKASPDGKKIAIAHNQLGTTEGGTAQNGCVYLYDFDNQTGNITNGLLIRNNISPYGIEFSAQSKKLYVSDDNGIAQYDLQSPILTRTVISNRLYAALQLGPDRKIYKANLNSDVKYLDVINSPELAGLACDYQERAIYLGDYGSSTFGLPPFITSVFSTSIIEKNTCLGDITTFETASSGTIDNAVWDFGDGSPSVTNISTSHAYASAGTYDVSVSVTIAGSTVNDTKQITINPLPNAIRSVLSQCSPDGISETNIFFNLNLAHEDLSDEAKNRETTFFISYDNADENINPLPVDYKNITNPQVLYARVSNTQTGCYSITELEIRVNTGAISNYEIAKCDNDGTEDGLYNFTLSDADIATDFPTAMIFYYKNIDDALLKQNQIYVQHRNVNNNIETVYARLEELDQCLGIYPIKLIVNPLPKIKTEDTDYICTNLPNHFITLTPNLLTGNTTGLRYKWSTGQETQTINVNQAGTYTVTVTNTFGCEKIRTITVLPSNNATIENVEIKDISDNNTVTIYLTSTSLGNYLYSLDAPSGPFQASNHFENVSPGFHTVYIYDDRGCGIVSKEISVLKIPKFFTPNGDGRNETWDIIGINSQFYANSKIYIFDRYGKLLADIKPLSNGWNGIYNGQPLPSSDYWYVVKFENGRIVKGHFSLVR